MSQKQLNAARWVVVVVLAIVIGVVTFAANSALSGEWGCAALSVLGDISAILFGVFGVWLGLFYRPNIGDDIKGKSGSELKRAVSIVVSNSKRFDIVYRGMRASAGVLVFSMIVRTFKGLVLSLMVREEIIAGGQFLFAYFVIWAILIQGHAVIMSIVPMTDARKKMHEARKDAEFAMSV